MPKLLLRSLLAGCAVLAVAAAAGCGSVSTTVDKGVVPTVDAIDPAFGPIAGGTTVKLTGSNFSAGTTLVLVGNHLASMVTVASDTELTFVLPAGDQEGAVVDITVANDSGFGGKTEAFTYNAQPVILSITPTIGKAAGGTPITITGRGFQAAGAGTPTVTVAGSAATSVTVVDDKTITATTAAADAATKPFTFNDVVVETGNGTGTLPGAYEITSQGILAFDRATPSHIFHVGGATGSSRQIATSQRRIGACALNPATGVLYVETRNQTNGLHELATLDPLSGDLTVIGPTTDSGGSTNRGLASLTFVGNTLYGLSVGQNASCCNNPLQRLMTVNTTTGAVTVVGGTAQAVTPGAILVKDANTVNYAGNASGSFDTMATGSSVKTTGLAFAGGGNGRVTGLINDGTTTYLVERNPPGALVYTLNTGTAVLTKLGEIQTPNLISSACQTPPSF